MKRVGTVMRTFAAVGSLWLALAPGLAHAQTAGTSSLSLSPAVTIARGKFGQSMKQTITLVNGTADGFGYRMSAVDVIVKNGRRVFVPAGDMAGSIAASAIYSRRSGYVAAGAHASVQVLLTVPEHTAVRAVAIYFNATSDVGRRGSVGLRGSLGALITFVLTKDFALEARALRVHPATASSDLTVAQQLDNVGTEPLVPHGVVAFIDARGALAAKVAFQSRRLLPGESAAFTAQYAGRLPAGRYRVIATFQYEGKTLSNEGVYTAP